MFIDFPVSDYNEWSENFKSFLTILEAAENMEGGTFHFSELRDAYASLSDAEKFEMRGRYEYAMNQTY